MFGNVTLGALGLLLVISVIAREPTLFLLVLALLVAASLSRLWQKHCLTGVEYRRHFSQRRAAFGEEVQLELEIVNRKVLPLSWLEIDDEIPRELPPTHGRVYASHKPGRSLLGLLFALRPYERVRRRYTIACLTRGEHAFGPAEMRSGDLFGFVTSERNLEPIDTLVVFPRVVPLTELGLPARQPLGDLKARSWIFEDASRIAGARDYQPGDGLRRIHWPASVRSQRLQSKVYEATTSHKLAVFLNVATSEGARWGPGYDPEVLELSITSAGSIAKWGLEQGYQVGLYTNGMHHFSLDKVAVQPGRDPSQYERIMMALGRLIPVDVKHFDTVLAEESARLAFGATVIVVTGILTAPAAEAILAMRARGQPVTLILTGRQEMRGSLDGVVIRRVGPPDSWKEMTELSVRPEGATT